MSAPTICFFVDGRIGCRSDGGLIAVGKQVETGVTNPDGYTLNYNEYVVYDLKQIKLKFLVEVEFKF